MRSSASRTSPWSPRRQGDQGFRLEQHAAALRGIAGPGAQLLDAGALGGERRGDLPHHAGAVLPHQVQPQGLLRPGIARRAGREAGIGDVHPQAHALMQVVEGAGEVLNPFLGHLHQDHTGELAGQMRQAALQPVPAMEVDLLGEGRDQSFAVITDRCEHELSHVAQTIRGRAPTG